MRENAPEISLHSTSVFATRRFTSLLIFVFAVFVSGCATTIHPPFSNSKKKISSSLANNSWEQVLTRFVDSEGRVDFNRLSHHSLPLRRYVRFISQTSPTRHPDEFPTRGAQLAFYINSYNAVAMYGVISSGFPEDFDGVSGRAKFFIFTDFNVGGEDISLYDYENDVLRPLGDPRIHFALNCMVKSCPRLPQIPFYKKTIDQFLDSLTVEFVNDSRHVRVIESARLVRLSAIFDFYTEDFVNRQTAPSLIAYINRYREDRIPENFEVEFIDYDWTVNSQ